MEIYIEDFLIQNFIINFCLLRLVFLTTKNNTSIFRLFLSATLGAGFSVISAITLNNIVVINILKFLCSTIMIATAFKSNLKEYIINFLLFFAYTYAFGGAILSSANQTAKTNFGIAVLPKFNLYLITLILIGLTYLLEFVSKHIKNKILTNKYVYEISILSNKQSINLNAYLDSGNLMKINGKPVIVIDFNTYLKITNSNPVDFYIKNINKVSTNTITSKKQLPLIELEYVEIKLKNKVIKLNNQPAILTNNQAFISSNYKVLLSPLLFS